MLCRLCRLKVELASPVAANLVSVVLADQEVVEDLRGDEGEEGPPNIDISFVEFRGATCHVPVASQAWHDMFSSR